MLDTVFEMGIYGVHKRLLHLVILVLLASYLQQVQQGCVREGHGEVGQGGRYWRLKLKYIRRVKDES